MMRTWLALVVPVVTLAAVAEGRADSGFRCPSGRLVSVGDPMAEVRGRCGEPDGVTQRTLRRRIKHRVTRRVGNVEESYVEEQEVEVPIDEWTYDLGRTSFVRYVLFEDGRVIDVTTGGYGSK